MNNMQEMEINYYNIEKGTSKSVDNTDEFSYIQRLPYSCREGKILAVNPRAGQYLQKFLESGNVIDSFVSDDEWVEVAEKFSNTVYAGYSHHPLEAIKNQHYEVVIVCEDMAYVDDVDAMFIEYYRLLKPSGVLIGGIWNVSYASNIDSIISGESIKIDSPLCGASLIPLDTLLPRLDKLGFSKTDVYRLPGDRRDCEIYAEISNNNANPVKQEVFNTKVNFICVYK